MGRKSTFFTLSLLIFSFCLLTTAAFGRNFIFSKNSTFSTFDLSGYTSSGKIYIKVFEESINDSNVKKSKFSIRASGKETISGDLIWNSDLQGFVNSANLDQFESNEELTVNFKLESRNGSGVGGKIKVNMGENVPVANAGPDHINAGFGVTVTLDGKLSSGNELTYSWSISNANDKSLVTLTDNGDGTASFTLPEFDAIVTPQPYQPVYDKAKMFAMTYDLMGAYEVRLTVSDDQGRTSSDFVEISATSRSTGLKNVPVGKPIYMVAPEQETYEWVLSTKPGKSSAVLNESTNRIPNFTPDIEGNYVVEEKISVSNIEIHAGTFVGVGSITFDALGKKAELPSCSVCHKFIHQSWQETHHSFALTNKYNGFLTDGETPFPFFREFCVKCHTTGFDRAKTANNGGFDDEALKEGWTFPLADQEGNVNPENFNNLLVNFPKTAQKSQVQCEMCHGPGSKPHVFEKSNIDRTLHPTTCGQCHAYVPFRNRYVEWLGSAHARSVRMGSNFAAGIPAGVTPDNPVNGCGVHCHTVEGFLNFRVKGGKPDPNMYAGRRNDAVPVSCILCHHPMNNFGNADSDGNILDDGRKQLRFYGKTTIPKWNEDETEVINVEVDAGPAAICTKCHLHNMYLKDYAGNVKPEPVPFKVGEGNPIHQQAQVYFGIGASEYAPDEFGLGEYPKPTHVTAFRETFDEPEYCVHCHMFRYDTRDEQFGKLGSHTWEMNYLIEDELGRGGIYDSVMENAKPCFSCHEDAQDDDAPGGYSFKFAEKGEEFLDNLLNQLKDLLPQDERGRVVWNADGDDFGTPEEESDDIPPLTPLVAKAAFNYYFIANDGSDGHHNMAYAVRLIGDAIRSLGETPIQREE